MSKKMRIYHRYLGFFLAGIMAVYAISGMTLIFRDTALFKKETEIRKVLPPDTKNEDLGNILGIRGFKIKRVDQDMVYFQDGTYNLNTHEVVHTKKELPLVLDKMTHLHKATSSRPLAFLNIFFGASLLFFVVSSYWMFMPGTSIFKKGMYFTLAGLVFAVLLIFL